MLSNTAFKFTLLTLFLILVFAGSLSFGATQSITPALIFDALFNFDQSINHTVVWDIRLSRSTAAAFIGLNYAIAGLCLQAITRNDLASPSILGISQGAILFVSLGLLFPVISLGKNVMAMLGAIIFGAITFTFAGGLTKNLSPVRMVLVGVTVGAFAIALVRITFLLDDSLSRDIIAWLSGSITDMRWPKVWPLIYWTLPCLVLSWQLTHKFNLLSLGEAATHGLGINPITVRIIGATLAAILTASAVTVCGPIAFIGLVIPHIAKRLFSTDYRVLFFACLLLGPILMLTADVVSKAINFPYETPVGVVCALIGAPYFLYQTLNIRTGEQHSP